MSKHPARYSPQILDALRPVLASAPWVHDPFAGTGERLGALCDELGVPFSGTELEAPFIAHWSVLHGDSRELRTYPSHWLEATPRPPRWWIFTSPVYPNGMCLAQDERILTADLVWQPVGDVREGDQLLAFDEAGDGRTSSGASRRRRYRRTTVTHSEPILRECVRVVLADGSEVVTTPDHPWLVYGKHRMGWVASSDLMGRPGSGKGGKGGLRRPCRVARVLPTWDRSYGYHDGWLSGMYDGEGSLSLGGDGAPKLIISQRPGAVLDRVVDLMRERGYLPGTYLGTGTASDVHVGGGMANMLRVLGELRPLRLLEKLGRLPIEQCVIQPKPVDVVAVEPAGARTIQSISTDSRTYIGEGFLMHNTDHFVSSGVCSACKGVPFRLVHGCPKCQGTGERKVRRATYRQAAIELSGDPAYALDPANMGRHGVRSGRLAEERYWRLAEEVVACWGGAERAIVNVKDFYRTVNGIETLYEVTARWEGVMADADWILDEWVRVPCPGMRNGANREARVDHEDVLVFER